jgi:beta-xylosidase
MTSAIGLATTPTLDPADPAYQWTDLGTVVQSREGGYFNTIDPSVLSDDNGALWLAFGSYWSGIKLVQLDPKTGKRLAQRRRSYRWRTTSQFALDEAVKLLARTSIRMASTC